MATILPFRPMVVTQARAAEVASVPYDVVTREEAAKLAHGKALNFLRVVRSEIDLPNCSDSYSPTVYHQALINLRGSISAGAFREEPHDTLLIYEITSGSHTQTGVVGVVPIEDYTAGRVRIHEKTRPDKEADRTRHIVALEAQAEPVFLAFVGTPEIESILAQSKSEAPLVDIVTEDQIQHRIWRCRHSRELSLAFTKAGDLYIADGHHRSASACSACEILRQANPDHQGDEAYNFLLSVAFPHIQTRVLPYNRIIRAAKWSPQELLNRLALTFAIKTTGHGRPAHRREFRLFLDSTWYSLKLRASEDEHGFNEGSLDLDLLQSLVLEPIFGIEDQRTDKTIDFVGGSKGTEELERLVDSGEAFCAISLYPVSIDELFAIADQGKLMPPKSTWFEPKLRSGLFLFPFRHALNHELPFAKVTYESHS